MRANKGKGNETDIMHAHEHHNERAREIILLSVFQPNYCNNNTKSIVLHNSKTKPPLPILTIY
jgi:hypothetical protein